MGKSSHMAENHQGHYWMCYLKNAHYVNGFMSEEGTWVIKRQKNRILGPRILKSLEDNEEKKLTIH